MSTQKFTDVPRGEVRDIIVVQPGETFGIHDPGKPVDCGAAFYDVYDWLDVRHVGTIAVPQYGDGPDHFSACGGRIWRVDPSTWYSHRSVSTFSQREFGFRCDNPDCDMHLVTNQYMQMSDFHNVLIHLMLKQVVPKLPCCNFVDCSQVKAGLVLTEEKAAAMRQLGFLAVDMCLWGILNNLDSTPHHTAHYGLGFMLMPDMNIRKNGCGVWSEWLQFLVCQKFLRLKEVYDSLSSELLGPKLARR